MDCIVQTRIGRSPYCDSADGVQMVRMWSIVSPRPWIEELAFGATDRSVLQQSNSRGTAGGERWFVASMRFVRGRVRGEGEGGDEIAREKTVSRLMSTPRLHPLLERGKGKCASVTLLILHDMHIKLQSVFGLWSSSHHRGPLGCHSKL